MEKITKSTAEIPIATRLYGSCDFTCSINGTFEMVEDNTAVSPNGEALSPNEPPAKTAPMTSDKLTFVLSANGIAIGIINAQVPQAEPIKYDAAHPIKNILVGIKNAGILEPTIFVMKFVNPKS